MPISVCMATFNGAAFLEPQLRSTIDQLGPRDELVISDDGSTDATLEIIRSLGDKRIRLLEGPRCGPSANFDNALMNARGQFVFLSDQDDIWEPHKIATQLPLLETHWLSVSDATVIDERGDLRHASYFELNGSGPGLLKNLLRCGFLGCCMAFRRGLLVDALPIPKGVAHDWWLGMVALGTGSVIFSPDRLVRYRRHSRNASYAAGVSRRSLAVKIADRARLSAALAVVRMRQLILPPS